jgi:hypothetical protein
METNHEEARYAWDYRWCSITDGSSLLNSMVATERGLHSANYAANAVKG